MKCAGVKESKLAYFESGEKKIVFEIVVFGSEMFDMLYFHSYICLQCLFLALAFCVFVCLFVCICL